jgi:hypothetical protein
MCIALPEYFHIMCSGLTRIIRCFFCTIFWNEEEMRSLNENLYYVAFVQKVLLVMWVWLILIMFQLYITSILKNVRCTDNITVCR